MTKSGKRRIFQCGECGETFSETRDTVFYDLRAPEDKVMMALDGTGAGEPFGDILRSRSHGGDSPDVDGTGL